MSKTREEVTDALLAEASDTIEELLQQVDGEEPTLAELEDVALELQKRVEQQLIETVRESQEATRPAQKPECRSCDEGTKCQG